MSENARKEKEELNNLLHNHLCEIMPSICEDSGEAEWSQGELQKMIDAFMSITEYWKYRAALSAQEEELINRNKELSEVVQKNEKLLQIIKYGSTCHNTMMIERFRKMCREVK